MGCELKTASMAAASPRSAWTKETEGETRASRWPSSRVSTTTTCSPASASMRTVWEPMYPAPPVTRMAMMSGGIES